MAGARFSADPKPTGASVGLSVTDDVGSRLGALASAVVGTDVGRLRNSAEIVGSNAGLRVSTGDAIGDNTTGERVSADASPTGASVGLSVTDDVGATLGSSKAPNGVTVGMLAAASCVDDEGANEPDGAILEVGDGVVPDTKTGPKRSEVGGILEVGVSLGNEEGTELDVGCSVSTPVGDDERRFVSSVGTTLPAAVGAALSASVGAMLGTSLGAELSISVGAMLGNVLPLGWELGARLDDGGMVGATAQPQGATKSLALAQTVASSRPCSPSSWNSKQVTSVLTATNAVGSVTR